MKKSLTITFILLIFASCVSNNDLIDSDISSQIPDDASIVILETDLSDGRIFDQVRQQLIRDGHRVDSDEELLTISTEGVDIRQSTLARYTLYIEDGVVTGRADWKPSSEANAMASGFSGVDVEYGWEKAVWTNGRPGRAYASLVKFMNQFDHESIEYK